jgi:hypothetical protein
MKDKIPSDEIVVPVPQNTIYKKKASSICVDITLEEYEKGGRVPIINWWKFS